MDVEDPDASRELVGVAVSCLENGERIHPGRPSIHRRARPSQTGTMRRDLCSKPLLENSLLPKLTLSANGRRCSGRVATSRSGAFNSTPTIASYLLDPARHAHRLEDVSQGRSSMETSQMRTAVRGKGKKALNWDEARDRAPSPQFANERADLHVPT